MKLLKLIFPIFLLLLIYSCDGGLSPNIEENIKPGFGGKITFIGSWNKDINLTYIVLFKDPLLTESDFNANNLKFVSDPIPKGTKEFFYNTIDNKSFGKIDPGQYAYLAVVQSPALILNLTRSSWTVAGIYTDVSNNLPQGKIIVTATEFSNDVNIVCDFNNPPPQPPGGSK
ncbi:MAG: hypothetical protein CVV23_13900 [Ignavibacteriae bacterium HGW-Ignavibacteriae-2]|jgi:hypothetical protein|nr:hypothetical protein [Bacteroidota bacterium]PKL87709.1 MAG: hypothetical protein CVV23_13900 [Ignavibacteriae bacterium HGW-Ignavibacteriae-2]